MRHKIKKAFLWIGLDKNPDRSLHPLENDAPGVTNTDLCDSVRQTESWLRVHQPSDPVPPLLHGRIMEQIRGVERSRRSLRAVNTLFRPSPVAVGIAISCAIAVAILTGRWRLQHRPSVSPEEAGAIRQMASVLASCQRLARIAPQAATAPLANEMSYLRSDTGRATEVATASLAHPLIRDAPFRLNLLSH